MKSIPAEILIYIFRLLHQNDKLQCMLVCHEWESVIKSTVLLETLSISSKKGLDSIISNVQKEPSYGTQAKRLLLQVDPGSDFDLSILPKLFPNVLDFYMTTIMNAQPNGFDPWYRKVKHFFRGDHKVEPEDYPEGDLEQFGKMFASNIWSNLTALEIRGGSENFDSKLFLNTFLNTPALKHLKLYSMGFGVDDFEFIHSALPSLNSLCLTDTDYIIYDPPKNIVPAYSVTSLSIVDSYTGELLFKEMLFLYILQKYPNLSELAIGVNVAGDHDEETEFVRNEWDNLLMNLAPRLQKLHLQLPSRGEFNYILRALDRSNCQLISLTMGGNVDKENVNLLPDLNQSKYIQSLRIMDLGGTVYQRLNLMKMLTELDLIGFDDGIETANFNDLLTMCGENLETLKITHLELKRPSITKNVTASVFNRLKILELTDVCLSSSISSLISWSFPQLHTLKLRDCFKEFADTFDAMDADLHIMIPNINLRYLEIIDTFGPDRYVLVLTLCNNEKRLYTTKSGEKAGFYAFEKCFGLRDSSIYPPTVSLEYGKKLVDPFLTIICNSVKDIFLSGI